MATKLKRAHLKRCDGREQQRHHVGGEKSQNTSTNNTKDVKNLSHARKDHVLNINLCFKLSFIFTDIIYLHSYSESESQVVQQK